jgi:molybdopterin synthase catalytic subunit
VAERVAVPSSDRVVQVAVVTSPIDIAALIARVQDDGVGAIATFIGTVREHNDGRVVTGIDYEAYEPMASRELERVAVEVADRWPGVRVAVEHRVGTLQVREASVAIACAHARRAPAMEAMRHCIEALKVRVPIWKREHYADGTREWVDPTRPAVST